MWCCFPAMKQNEEKESGNHRVREGRVWILHGKFISSINPMQIFVVGERMSNKMVGGEGKRMQDRSCWRAKDRKNIPRANLKKIPCTMYFWPPAMMVLNILSNRAWKSISIGLPCPPALAGLMVFFSSANIKYENNESFVLCIFLTRKSQLADDHFPICLCE